MYGRNFMICELCGYDDEGTGDSAHVCIQGNKIARELHLLSSPRPLSRVRVKAEWKDVYDSFYPPKELPLIFMGEIPNMKGHALILGNRGAVYAGMHIEVFEEIPEDSDEF